MRSTSWRMWLETTTWSPSLARPWKSASASARAIGSRPFNGSPPAPTPGRRRGARAPAERQGQADPLPHPLAVARELAVGRFGHRDALERLRGGAIGLGADEARQP